MIILVIIALTIIALIVMSFRIDKGNVDDFRFRKDYTDAIKVVLSIIIVLHHLSRSVFFGDCVIGAILQKVGFICVAGFFTISGWGSSVSFSVKRDSKNYWNRKLKSIIIPYFIAFIAYSGYEMMSGGSIDSIIQDYLQGTPTVSYSWYIIALLYMYFSHWISVKIGGGTLHKPLFVTFAILYCIFVFGMGWGTNWIGTFYIYFLAALFHSSVWLKCKIAKYKRKVFSLSIVLLIISFYEYYMYESSYGLLLEVIASISFMNVIIIGGDYLSYRNNIICDFIKRITLEIYLYHGALIGVVTRLVTNLWFIAPLVLVGTVFVAVCINTGYNMVIQFINKYSSFVKKNNGINI